MSSAKQTRKRVMDVVLQSIGDGEYYYGELIIFRESETRRCYPSRRKKHRSEKPEDYRE